MVFCHTRERTLILAHVVWHEKHIVRRKVLNVKNSFNGEFQEGCQKHSVPPSLLALLGMIMKGPTRKCDHTENQACLSIAHFVVQNSVARARQRSEVTSATTPNKVKGVTTPSLHGIKTLWCNNRQSSHRFIL